MLKSGLEVKIRYGHHHIHPSFYFPIFSTIQNLTLQASLVDKQDGSYELHYTATVAGVYNLTVSLRDPVTGVWTAVSNQPMQITVVNGQFAIAQCGVKPAPGLSTTVVSGVPFNFTVVARCVVKNDFAGCSTGLQYVLA